jgi:hypothetical protein
MRKLSLLAGMTSFLVRVLPYPVWAALTNGPFVAAYWRLLWLGGGRQSPLRDRSFDFAGRRYPYLVHPYNSTWRNERAVEVPIALGYVEEAPGARMLEIGNVLSHYGPITHRVLDRYERGANVLNVDFDTWSPEEPFDRIVSVSTFEHMGRDEKPRRDGKALRAFEKVAEFLSESGSALITFPVGWNEALDQAAGESAALLGRTRALSRLNRQNEWAETQVEEALSRSYGSAYPYANAVIVCRLGAVENPAVS